MKKAYTIIIGFLLMSQCNVWAQQGTSATGGEATGIDGTVSYTIGQTDYIIAYGSDGSVSQGVQQPYVIGIVTGFLETDINLSCAISPNPTTDFVVLNVEKGEIKNLSYGLFDLKGRMIKSGSITASTTTISLAEFADALYLMRVFNNDTEVKSFKLIKNK